MFLSVPTKELKVNGKWQANYSIFDKYHDEIIIIKMAQRQSNGTSLDSGKQLATLGGVALDLLDAHPFLYLSVAELIVKVILINNFDMWHFLNVKHFFMYSCGFQLFV